MMLTGESIHYLLQWPIPSLFTESLSTKIVPFLRLRYIEGVEFLTN